MEFEGQRGDPLLAWSVGKYAKRSATIHLCSEDCQTTANQVFSSTIATYTDNGSVTVFDTGKNIRDAIQDGQEPRVRVYNPGFNTTLDTTTVSLFGGTGDSAKGADFTKIQLGDHYKARHDNVNALTPINVRTVDTTADYDGLGTANGDIIIQLYGGSYFFLVKMAAFPTVAESRPNQIVRLARDLDLQAKTKTVLWDEQFDKGNYVLDLQRYTTYPNIAASAALYFVRVGFNGYEYNNGERVSMKGIDVPVSVATYLATLGLAEGGSITVGGDTAGAHQNPGTANQADAELITWNLFPGTKIDGITHRFANSTDNHCNYTVTIPNTVGYPEHKRCLIQVQSLSCHAEAHIRPDHTKRLNPPYVGVEVEGLAVQNNFSSHVNLSSKNRFDGRVSDSSVIGYFNINERNDFTATGPVSAFAYCYENNKSILDDSVLCASPFGKQLRIKILNLTSKDFLNTNCDDGVTIRDASESSPTDIINNPTHLTLRILFLDDDDLPMR